MPQTDNLFPWPRRGWMSVGSSSHSTTNIGATTTTTTTTMATTIPFTLRAHQVSPLPMPHRSRPQLDRGTDIAVPLLSPQFLAKAWQRPVQSIAAASASPHSKIEDHVCQARSIVGTMSFDSCQHYKGGGIRLFEIRYTSGD
jgi:hypothetical protein